MIGQTNTQCDRPRTIWIGGGYPAAPASNPVKPPPTSVRALEYIRSQPGKTTAAIAEAIGVNHEALKDSLQRLRRKGVVHSIYGSAPRLHGGGTHPQSTWYPGPDTGALR